MHMQQVAEIIDYYYYLRERKRNFWSFCFGEIFKCKHFECLECEGAGGDVGRDSDFSWTYWSISKYCCYVSIQNLQRQCFSPRLHKVHLQSHSSYCYIFLYFCFTIILGLHFFRLIYLITTNFFRLQFCDVSVRCHGEKENNQMSS